MSVLVGNPFFLGAGASAGAAYQIERSLRFNSSDSAYLSRTPSSTGNRRTWTWAGWVKRVRPTWDNDYLFGAYYGGSLRYEYLSITSSDRIEWFSGLYDTSSSTVTSGRKTTSAVFRDVGAWYHIVAVKDTTQATAANRFKLYVNGVQILLFDTSTNPALNDESFINDSSTPHRVGGLIGSANSSQYLADVHFIDGQALTPSSFTEVSATTGQLIPKAYADVLPGPVTIVPSIAEGALIIKADAATITGSVTAAGFVKVHSSSDGINWTYREQILSGALSFSAKYIAIGGGSTNSRTFNPSTGGSYTWAEYSAGTQFDTTSNITLNVTGLSYTANSTVTAPFGTNGFWLKFSDNSAATATTLGKDYSGNSNNWTPNNLSVTAGAGNDSLTDTPTSYGTGSSGGDVRGNFCTWNPLAKLGDITQTLNVSNGNLTFSGSSNIGTIGTIGMSSGKWYWELNCTSLTASQLYFGMTSVTTAGSRTASFVGIRDTGALSGSANGATTNGSGTTAFTTGDVVGFAYDADNKRLFVAKNNTWLNSSDPAAGTNASFTDVQGSSLYPFISDNNTTATIDANWGARPFAYTAPSGFKALCDTNLPAPVVAQPSTVMDVKLYTGNGTSQTISGLSFSPDFVWLKSRGAAYNHQLFDTIRGTGKQLFSNSTSAETTESFSWLNAFNSNGFGVTGAAGVNDTNDPMVAWCFDAGSNTVSNTQGSITSQVRANASAGFSIVTYTGTGGTGTVGHGLGVAPSMLIVKNRSNSVNWAVAHAGLSSNRCLNLNTISDDSTVGFLGLDKSSFTSTTFTVNYSDTNTTVVNGSSNNYVAYCFAPVAGYSSFGSYTGNGSTDGPFIYTGFRPRWVMIKSTSFVSDWCIFDAARDGYNANNDSLYPNSSNYENYYVLENEFDILSNGFKPRANRDRINWSSATYVWAAFAENPFQFARAR